jgi:hypothetical protein
MDISAGLTSPGRKHGRSASFSLSILSLLTPSLSTPTGSPPSPSLLPLGHSRGRNTSAVAGVGAGEEINLEDPLPVFEVQSAMLAVDLELGPGEERSCRFFTPRIPCLCVLIEHADTYTVKLPANLPPTYKGRGMKFGYELVVGTCRAGSIYPHQSNTRFAKSQVTKGGVSRVMKVPIRVYNHVSGQHFSLFFLFDVDCF